MSRIVCCSAIALAVSGASAEAQTLASDSARRGAFVHYHAGQNLLAAEQWEKAADEFRAAIKAVWLLTDAHYGLGQSYMGMRRYASAAKAFEACIDAARSLHNLREKNRVSTDRAIDEEIRALRDSLHRVASGQIRVAQPQAKVTQVEQRMQDLARSRSSTGGHFQPPASVMLSLGSAHFRNGDARTAEKLWSQAVAIDDKLGEGWNNLAVIYLASSRPQDAQNAIRRAERAGFRVNPQLKDDINAMR